MAEKLTDEFVKYLLSLVIDNANDARDELKKDKNSEFNQGKSQAYYEVLDTIKNQLIVREVDLKQFGLDINLEDEYL